MYMFDSTRTSGYSGPFNVSRGRVGVREIESRAMNNEGLNEGSATPWIGYST